jgi:hypothetical protein
VPTKVSKVCFVSVTSKGKSDLVLAWLRNCLLEHEPNSYAILIGIDGWDLVARTRSIDSNQTDRSGCCL